MHESEFLTRDTHFKENQSGVLCQESDSCLLLCNVLEKNRLEGRMSSLSYNVTVFRFVHMTSKWIYSQVFFLLFLFSDDLFKIHKLKPTQKWRQQFESYLKTMPIYYAQVCTCCSWSSEYFPVMNCCELFFGGFAQIWNLWWLIINKGFYYLTFGTFTHSCKL